VLPLGWPQGQTSAGVVPAGSVGERAFALGGGEGSGR
jgi:hypothetical protein